MNFGGPFYNLFGTSKPDIQDDGVFVTSWGSVQTINFTGAGVTASYSAGVLTVNITSGGGGSGTVTSVAATAPAAGFTITGSPITTSGTFTFALADDLAALEALTGTNTIYYRSGISTWSPVTVSTGLSFTGGTLSSTITQGVTTLSAIGATPNANGATITGSTLNLEPASASFGGVVTTGAQSFAGVKTFTASSIATSSASFDVFNTTATTVNAFGAATTLTIGATTGTMTLRNATIVGSNATQALFNTVATTMNFAGAATAINIGAITGTATINNPTVVGSQTTVNLWNTTSTTVNAFGAATSIVMGATTGTATLRNPTVVGTQTTATLWNTVATTVSAFGAATTMTIGGTPTTAITHNYSTNATATGTTKTINFGTGGAAGSTTAINIGSATGTATNITLGIPGSATGDIWYRNASGFMTRLGIGSTSHMLSIASGIPAWQAFVEQIDFQDINTSIAATTYTLVLYANYAFTINELKIISGSGTCTAAVQINGTNVTGISAVSVSTTIATGTASGANSVSVGQKVTLVITSPSTLDNLQATLKITRA